jgi:hypothetical protein
VATRGDDDVGEHVGRVADLAQQRPVRLVPRPHGQQAEGVAALGDRGDDEPARGQPGGARGPRRQDLQRLGPERLLHRGPLGAEHDGLVGGVGSGVREADEPPAGEVDHEERHVGDARGAAQVAAGGLDGLAGRGVLGGGEEAGERVVEVLAVAHPPRVGARQVGAPRRPTGSPPDPCSSGTVGGGAYPTTTLAIHLGEVSHGISRRR